MTVSSRPSSPIFPVGLTIALVLVMRLATLGHLPFLDASDSRYALVAKLMVDDGEVFIPKIYRDGLAIPFWSKPPFHFWLQAASVKVLGASEFAARLPSFLGAVLMLALTGYCGYRLLGTEPAALAMLLLCTSGLFYFLAGSTLVDMTLSTAITGVMVSAMLCSRSSAAAEGRLWGYLCFVFAAVGFLTKGPIAILLPGLAICTWTLLHHDLRLLRQLPWIRGVLGFLCLTAPVFLIQEYFTPGYLRYFFLNENLLRYLVAVYGEKYGSGHRQPYGTSVFYLFVGFLPWTLLLIPLASRERCREFLRDPTLSYLVCWVAAPTSALIFARQLLGTYLLPTFSGLALLISAALCLHAPPEVGDKTTRLLRALATVLALISASIFAWTVRERFSWLHGVLSLAVLISLVWAAWSLRKSASLSQALGLGALSLALFYTSQILNLCRFSERQYSVAAVLRIVEQQHRMHRPLLYFPFGVPNSAYLYANQRLVDGRNAMTLSLDTKNELILVRDKQVSEFRRRFGRRFQALLRHGKWIVFHAENHAGSCQSAMRRTHKRRDRDPPSNSA